MLREAWQRIAGYIDWRPLPASPDAEQPTEQPTKAEALRQCHVPQPKRHVVGRLGSLMKAPEAPREAGQSRALVGQQGPTLSVGSPQIQQQPTRWQQRAAMPFREVRRITTPSRLRAELASIQRTAADSPNSFMRG